MKRRPLGKVDSEPMEDEADSDEEEGKPINFSFLYHLAFT